MSLCVPRGPPPSHAATSLLQRLQATACAPAGPAGPASPWLSAWGGLSAFLPFRLPLTFRASALAAVLKTTASRGHPHPLAWLSRGTFPWHLCTQLLGLLFAPWLQCKFHRDPDRQGCRRRSGNMSWINGDGGDGVSAGEPHRAAPVTVLLQFLQGTWALGCPSPTTHCGAAHLREQRGMDPHQDAVHLAQLAPDQRAVGPGNVADVVQPQVVKDQHVPVPSLQDFIQMPRDIVVHLQGRKHTRRASESPALPHKHRGLSRTTGATVGDRVCGSLKRPSKNKNFQKN